MPQKITTVGLTEVARLVGTAIDYAAIGTNDADPAVGNTRLGTETNRLPTDSLQLNDAIVEHRTFFNNSLLPTEVKEAGWLMNAIGVYAAEEILFSRATFSFVADKQDMLLILSITVSEV